MKLFSLKISSLCMFLKCSKFWGHSKPWKKNNLENLEPWTLNKKGLFNQPAAFPGVLSKIASAKSRNERSMLTFAFALVSAIGRDGKNDEWRSSGQKPCIFRSTLISTFFHTKSRCPCSSNLGGNTRPAIKGKSFILCQKWQPRR